MIYMHVSLYVPIIQCKCLLLKEILGVNKIYCSHVNSHVIAVYILKNVALYLQNFHIFLLRHYILFVSMIITPYVL